MVIRDCNKDNKWAWLYIMTKHTDTIIHFNGFTNYVSDDKILEFIKR